MDEHLLSLIKKYNQGKCTAEEKEQLEAWYNAASLDNSEVKPPATGWEAAGKTIWNNVRVHKPARHRRIHPQYWQAAAVLLLVTLAAAYWLWQHTQQPWTEIRTATGEIRHITLPDSSSVTMNGNATIRYATHWENAKEREVWITGEAFFKVQHLHRNGTTIKRSDRFLVHAGQTQITVLGTSFNVKTQAGTTSVVLETGHIKLNREKEPDQAVDLRPGEMVTVNSLGKTIKKEKINTNIYTAWKVGKLELDKTNFEDIVNFIAYNYGHKVGVRDTSLLHRQLSGGTVDTKNEQQLYKLLSTILNISIRQKGDSLIISHQ